MKLNAFSTIPFFSVLERTATWTSQRNCGASTSYEEKNVLSGQGAMQGPVNCGLSARELKRRAWMRRAVAKRTDSLAQHRRGGMNHNVALMGDVVTISQKNELKTEGTVCSVADEETHQNHDEVKALQEFKPKSLSAAGLKLKTEHKEDDDADFCFPSESYSIYEETFRQEET
jgi:hypothetical protein